MRAQPSMAVAKKLTLAFSTVVLVLLLVAGASLYTKAQLTEADRWNNHTYRVLDTSAVMLKAMVDMETGARGFLVAGDEKFLEPWVAGKDAFDKSWEATKELTADNDEQQVRLTEMQSLRNQFERVVDPLLMMRREVGFGARTMDEVVQTFALGRDKAAMDAFRETFADFSNAERDLLVIRSAAADQIRQTNLYVVVGGSLLAIVTSVLMGLWISTSIRRQLGGEPAEAAAIAGEIAQGNLTVTIPVKRGDSSSLMASIEHMRRGLSTIVGQVRASSDSIATGTQQIATGNADLSARTEQQASNLEETAASVEELTGNVNQTSQNAQRASEMAAGASQAAEEGGVAVGQVVQTMEQITTRSAKIADIIGVIDGIAFQTNILALNAAVEAARAGEAGRGFAVVAGEVRSLAKRSADAAKEIKSLIDDSVSQVKIGNDQVAQAGKAMEQIVAQVKQVSALIGDIAESAREQNGGIAQVNQAIGMLDQMTQQNAALVEEGASAADSLAQQARQLAETVEVFRIEASASGAAFAASAQPALPTATARLALGVA